ncbi:MAG: CpaF family protein [Candidatus Omnitrophica bacterium]|jgi:pilus assembly protein CpaF|nr:CpaF family protein [Candidatus Omnitrophota bacterium]
MVKILNKLKKLLDDPFVTEIMINGTEATFVEIEGKKQKVDVNFSEEDFRDIIGNIFVNEGKTISHYYPYGDVRTEEGARVNIIIYPLARCGTTITIRKFDKNIGCLDDLVKLGTLNQKMADFLIACIKGRVNILFSGATGAGKTTTMEMLSYHIPQQERIITIEDTAELRLHHSNLVPMETRTPDSEGKGEVTLRDLIRNSLRMRPDRLIIGEIRGPEALDLIQAMSTGHRGTLAVIHGNSPLEIVSRLEALVLSSGIKIPIEEVKKMIGNTLNVIVQQERFIDGIRRITHISEVRGIEREEVAIQDLFIFQREGKTTDGKIKGKFKTVMRNYPRFFAEFQKLELLSEKIFSE